MCVAEPSAMVCFYEITYIPLLPLLPLLFLYILLKNIKKNRVTVWVTVGNGNAIYDQRAAA